MSGLTLIVAGSRHLRYQGPLIGQFLASFPQTFTRIVTGGAEGVDSSVFGPARAYGIPVEVVPADWGKYGKAAGPIRNQLLAELGDVLLLIWDGESRGSASMKREAEIRGLGIHEFIVSEGSET